MNHPGRLTNKCDSSQNGRGGIFFIIDDTEWHASLSEIPADGTAPLTVPKSPALKRRSHVY